jgi:hypothetical protein
MREEAARTKDLIFERLFDVERRAHELETRCAKLEHYLLDLNGRLKGLLSLLEAHFERKEKTWEQKLVERCPWVRMSPTELEQVIDGIPAGAHPIWQPSPAFFASLRARKRRNGQWT